MTESPKPNASRKVTVWTSVVALIAILVGGFFYLDVREDNKREARAYELLTDCQDPLVFEDFIAKFPDSEHIDEVRQRYQELAARQAEWESRVVNGTREELERFIKDNPTSNIVRVARARLDSMDWDLASRGNTIASYERYIQDHPEGLFIDQAEVQRQKLERALAAAAERAKQDSLATPVDSTNTLEGSF